MSKIPPPPPSEDDRPSRVIEKKIPLWKASLKAADILFLPFLMTVLFITSWMFNSVRLALILLGTHMIINFVKRNYMVRQAVKALDDLEHRAAVSDKAVLDVANIACEQVQRLLTIAASKDQKPL